MKNALKRPESRGEWHAIHLNGVVFGAGGASEQADLQLEEPSEGYLRLQELERDRRFRGKRPYARLLRPLGGFKELFRS